MVFKTGVSIAYNLMRIDLFKDLKPDIPGMFSSAFSVLKTEHIVYLIFMLISIPLIAIIFRKTSHKKLWFFSLFAWIALIILEITKLTYYHFVKNGIKWASISPLHPCSMFMYVMPFVLFCRNKTIRQASIAFICTFNLVGGLSNYIFPDVLKSYTLKTFIGFHSLIYHYLLLLVGSLFWSTKFYKPHWLDFIRAYIPHLIFSVPVIILDKIFINERWNYFWYNHGGKTAFDIIAKNISSHYLWTFIMVLMYFAMFLIIYTPVITIHIVKKIKNKQKTKETNQ